MDVNTGKDGAVTAQVAKARNIPNIRNIRSCMGKNLSETVFPLDLYKGKLEKKPFTVQPIERP